jgi:hypothetical protein
MKTKILIILLFFVANTHAQWFFATNSAPGKATQLTDTHYARVIADGGTVDSKPVILQFCKQYYQIRGTLDDIMLVAGRMFGYQQTSGATTKIYDLGGNDLTQTTSANRPIFLTWDATDSNYYISPDATNANYISTPNSTAFNNIGDLDVILKINISNFTTFRYLFERNGTAPNKQFYVWVHTNGKLEFNFSLNGTDVLGSASNALSAGLKWYRIKHFSSDGSTSFYSGTNGTTWTLINTVPNVGQTGNLANVNCTNIWCAQTTTNNSVNYPVYKIKIFKGFYDAGGTLISEFAPRYYHPEISKTTYTDSITNEVFTIGRDVVATGYKGEIIDRNTVLFDGINDKLDGAINYSGAFTSYYDPDYPNAYEIGTTAQTIGYKSSAFALAKSAMIIVVKNADGAVKLTAMQNLYNLYFLKKNPLSYLTGPFDQDTQFAQIQILGQ